MLNINKETTSFSGDGRTNVGIKFDYAEVNNALQSIITECNKISEIANSKITLSSLSGEAVESVVAYLNKVTNAMAPIATNVETLKNNIQVVYDNYKAKEANIKNKFSETNN